MSGVRVYYDWFAGTLSNLLAAGIMDDVDPGLTIGWKDGKQISEKKEETPWWEPTGRNNGGKGQRRQLKQTNRELVKSLLISGPEKTIIEASKTGHEEIVNVLIEKGVDVNTKDEYGFTPLSYAALKGHEEVVDQLIENGADVNIKNDWGGTALAQAVFFGHIEIAKVLIDNGADLDVKIHGKPLVKFATKNGYEELVDYLIENGIDAENHNEAARSGAQPKNDEEVHDIRVDSRTKNWIIDTIADYNNNKTALHKKDKGQSRFKKWRSKLRKPSISI